MNGLDLTDINGGGPPPGDAEWPQASNDLLDLLNKTFPARMASIREIETGYGSLGYAKLVGMRELIEWCYRLKERDA